MSGRRTARRLKDTAGAWVVRAGIKGSAHEHFLRKRLIVLADPGLGDLSRLEATRPAFYEAYRLLRPNETKVGTAGIGGKFFRFVHEMALEDIVIYPALRSGEVHVGRVVGRYSYRRDDHDFPHQRRVKWTGTVSKASLTVSAQFELGAARTLFQYKRHLSEVLRKARRTKTGALNTGQRRGR